MGSEHSAAAAAAVRSRLQSLLAEYSAQGEHRTGTEVDARSCEWLRALLAEAAAPAEESSVVLQPYDMVPGRLENDVCVVTLADGTQLEGRAIHNAASYTDVDDAPLHEWQEADAEPGGELGSQLEIACIFAEQGDRRFEIGAQNMLRDLRCSSRFKAYLFVYCLRALPDSEQIAMMNADPYNPPSGCLAVQLPPSCTERLRRACSAGEAARISCRAAFVPAASANVVARVEGAEPSLPPVVVMTPRSGWGPCASERGPGLGCFVEALRAVASAGRRPRRTVIFAANSGHELGHLGLEELMESMQQEVFVWIHLGASLGSRLPPEFPLFHQASDVQLEQLLVGFLRKAGLERLAPITQVGEKPVGEVRNVHERGGRYVSLVSPNAHFHHPTDIYPEAVDVEKTLSVSSAVRDVVLALMDMETLAADVPPVAKSDL